MTQWIVTAVGPDRPGLVGELTGHLHAGKANLLDSRMVNLRGQFAIVLLLDAAEAAPVPTVLVAVTVKVYGVPLVRPLTVIGEAAPVAVMPPGLDVTV